MIDLAKYRTPGQLIQELLEKRGWTHRVLAVVLGMDETQLGKIIAGKRPLDAKLALALAQLFGVPAELFMELQKSYELAQARITEIDDPALASRAHLFGSLPVAEMIKRRWISVDDIRDLPEVERDLAKFFGVKSAEEIEIFPHAAKKTSVFGGVTPVQLAWLYRVQQIAKEMLVPKYSANAVRDAVTKLKTLRISAEATRKAPKFIMESGIRYVIVEALTGSKIDGVCFWLDESSPVIGMSLRFDRIDNFWFVLRHELEHVLRLHGREAAMLDAELEEGRAGTGADIAEEEIVANHAASEFCVPQRDIDGFIARKFPFCAERDLIGFARTIQVHPGLVAGQLRHKLKRYDLFTKHLVKIRSSVAPSAMVDGWGDVAPVG